MQMWSESHVLCLPQLCLWFASATSAYAAIRRENSLSSETGLFTWEEQPRKTDIRDINDLIRDINALMKTKSDLRAYTLS